MATIGSGLRSASASLANAFAIKRKQQAVLDAANLKRQQTLDDRDLVKTNIEKLILAKLAGQDPNQQPFIDIDPGTQNGEAPLQLAQNGQGALPVAQNGQAIDQPLQQPSEELVPTTLAGQPGALAPSNLRKTKQSTLIGGVPFTPAMANAYANIVSVDPSAAAPTLNFLKFASDEQLAAVARQTESNVQVASAYNGLTTAEEIDLTTDVIVQMHGSKLTPGVRGMLQSLKNATDFKTKKLILDTALKLNTSTKELLTEHRAINADVRKFEREDILAEKELIAGQDKNLLGTLSQIEAEGGELSSTKVDQTIRRSKQRKIDAGIEPVLEDRLLVTRTLDRPTVINELFDRAGDPAKLKTPAEIAQEIELAEGKPTTEELLFDAQKDNKPLAEFLEKSRRAKQPASVQEFLFFQGLKTQKERDDFVGLKGEIAAGVAKGKEVGGAQGLAITELPKIASSTVDTVTLINTIVNHPGLDTVVGVRGFTGVVPLRGTDAANFNALLDKARGKAFLVAYDQLRGGGHISDAEGDRATAAMEALNTAQTQKEFIKNLNILKDVALRGLAVARKAAKGDFSESFVPGKLIIPEALAKRFELNLPGTPTGTTPPAPAGATNEFTGTNTDDLIKDFLK